MYSIFTEEGIGIPFKPLPGQGQIVREARGIEDPPKMPISPRSFRGGDIQRHQTGQLSGWACFGENGCFVRHGILRFCK